MSLIKPVEFQSTYEITDSEFKSLSQLVYSQVGIHLAEHKKMLVKSRLSKRLREFKFSTFKQYYEYLLEDNSGEELIMLINVISTNVTSFFREPNQWDYLEHVVKDMEAKGQRKLRIWSAACSSGQEPYTIGIFLHGLLKNPKDWDIKILATDISEDILRKAIKGQYTNQEIGSLPKNMLMKFFEKKVVESKRGSEQVYEIKDFLKKIVTFRSFNLVYGKYDILPKTFDMVFCRNVMIYFDKETKNKVVENLASKLKKDGLFFIGHSESLVSMKDSYLKLQKPSIYKLVK